jgi:hypothetical protein
MCRSLLSGISFFIELYGLFVYVFLTYSQLVDRKLESLASHTLIRLLLLLDLMLRMYKLFWSPTQRRLFMLMGISWNQPLHIIARFQTLFLLILLYLLLLLLIAILAIFFFPSLANFTESTNRNYVLKKTFFKLNAQFLIQVSIFSKGIR